MSEVCFYYVGFAFWDSKHTPSFSNKDKLSLTENYVERHLNALSIFALALIYMWVLNLHFQFRYVSQDTNIPSFMCEFFYLKMQNGMCQYGCIPLAI